MAADEDARAESHTIGELVAEQTRTALQAVDLHLQDLEAAIGVSGATTPRQIRQVLAGHEFYDVLVHLLAVLPQADVLSLIGADGKMVNTSRAWPTPILDASDRDYFLHFQEQNNGDTFISQPVRSRLTDSRMIFLARRLNGPGGKFLGVLLSSIKLKYFENIYGRIGLQEGAKLTLMREDGMTLMQYPVPEKLATRMPAESPWYAAVLAGGGTYRSPGFLTTGKYFVSVHPLKFYPVVLDSSMTEAVAFAHWKRQVVYIGGGMFCAILCILLLFRSLLAQFRRQEQQTNDLIRSGNALRESESRLLITLEHMDQGLIMVGANHKVAVYNQQAVEMLNLPLNLMTTNPPFGDLEAFLRLRGPSENADAEIQDLIHAANARAMPCTFESTLPPGRNIETRNVPVAGGGFVRTYTDITERKAAEMQIRYVARHDGLTGLANRLVLREHLEDELGRKRRDECSAVLCLDLDQFKNINDTLGHPMGDLLLRCVGDRLLGCVRDGDVIARLGGDEFAVVQAGVNQPANASLLADRIIGMLKEPFDIAGHQVMIGVSVGIAISGADGTDAETLMKHADMALYRAKADGRGVYRFFEPTMNAMVQARRALEIDMRAALANGEFEMFFQPILNARTRLLSGFEALIRWRHPVRGLVLPAEFIPLAEEIGLIIPIGEWALHDACRQAAEWRDDLKIAVNLSPVQFKSSNLVDATRSALAASGLNPARLGLEITESVLLQNSEATLDTLHRLHDLGVWISMDDFGTGYSSLSYLRSFPFDKIKIDQSFIRDLNGPKDSRAIVRAIMDLSRTLGMSVTAEGVETGEQFAILQAEGCAEAQGYLFSAPQPGKDVPAMIARLGAGAMEPA